MHVCCIFSLSCKHVNMLIGVWCTHFVHSFAQETTATDYLGTHVHIHCLLFSESPQRTIVFCLVLNVECQPLCTKRQRIAAAPSHEMTLRYGENNLFLLSNLVSGCLEDLSPQLNCSKTRLPFRHQEKPCFLCACSYSAVFIDVFLLLLFPTITMMKLVGGSPQHQLGEDVSGFSLQFFSFIWFLHHIFRSVS